MCYVNIARVALGHAPRAPFLLDVVACQLLNDSDRVPPDGIVLDHAVQLSCEHSLHVVDAVGHDDAIALGRIGISGVAHLLDRKELQGVLGLEDLGVIWGRALKKLAASG